MKKAIDQAVNSFLEETKNKNIKIISHFDTDGITSAAILIKTLKRLDKKFSIKILKSLEKETIKTISNNKKEVLVFLDLGSSSLEQISELENSVFVIDHHEITSKPGRNTTFINPHLFGEEAISASGLAYLFSKSINKENKDLANLAVIGLVGDLLEKEISRINNEIIADAEILIKKGLLLYPATRPIHKTLEFSSSLFIPGVTGNYRGALEMLKEIGIKKENGAYKSLIELDEEELSKLITAILLRTKKSGSEIIGNIYLVKIFNKLEDVREISALINACSRLGHSNTALSFCLENKKAIKKAEEIYASYKQELISGLSYAEQNKIEGRNYIILNAKDKIKDTIIGTIASIISMSSTKEEGTIVVAMAYDNERIKVSARVVGRNGKNVREILEKTIKATGGESGGHPLAAGCLIQKEKEKEFLNELIKNLELEVIKI